MKLKVCEYCGTEYKDGLPQCPLCGKGPGSEPPADEKKTRQQSTDSVPQWMWVLTCVLLAVAVVIGLVYFLVSMEYVGNKDAVEPVISAPVVEEPVEELPEEPVIEEEPVDLSCTGLTLSQDELVLDELGGHVFLTALPSPLDCEDEVVFSSLDETIATVDEGGMITAAAPGETEIIVTCGDIEESCTIICDFVVEEPEEEEPEGEEPEAEEEETPAEENPEEEVPQAPVELSSKDFTLFRPGEETVLTVKNAAEDAVITYASSDETVAAVSNTGKVVAVGDGVATITVTVDGQTLTCIARCNLGTTTENSDETEVVTGNLQLTHTDATLFNPGEAFTLYLTADGNKVTGAAYSSENTAVCTVGSSGLVTAVGSGTTNVNVTYGGKTYTCIVRCSF